MLENGKIRLDFGEHGRIDLPPAVALSLVSDANKQAEIRQAVMKARKQIRPFVKPLETINDTGSL